jgi:hypothetical protein
VPRPELFRTSETYWARGPSLDRHLAALISVAVAVLLSGNAIAGAQPAVGHLLVFARTLVHRFGPSFYSLPR